MIRGLIAATAVVATASVVDASTVTQTASFTGSQSISFLAFDTSLGSLTGVSASLSGEAGLDDGMITGQTGSVSLSLTGDDDFGFFGNVDGSIQISLGELSFFTIFLDGPSFSCITEVAESECTDEYFARTSSFNIVGDASDLSTFIGASINGSILFDTTVSEVEGTVSSGPTKLWTGSGRVDLTYMYVPIESPAVIPLPAALPLMLAGLGALFGLGLRRKRSG